MSFLENINFLATILTFGSISFTATNFGIKLGRLSGFKNNSGYQYISDAKNSDKLYSEIAKVANEDNNAPSWAKNETQLKNWCKSNKNSLRKWKLLSEYCLVKNNVRHKLIEQGLTLKTDTDRAGCTKELLDSYADNENALNFLIGRKECTEPRNS